MAHPTRHVPHVSTPPRLDLHVRSHRMVAMAALVAILGAIAFGIVLVTDSDDTVVPPAVPAEQSAAPAPEPSGAGQTRFDGGPEEGTAGVHPSTATHTNAGFYRFDGGPNEGTAGH
jgi:hypothetical protein